jgi:hypothetical protein
MRVREENCNMVLLAAVTAFSLAVAGAVALLEPAPAQAPRAEIIKPVYVADQAPVRVIGPPFVPNTNPRER